MMEEYCKDSSQIILNSQSQLYVFQDSNKQLFVRGSIGTLNINGSNNYIVIESSVPCLIIIGNDNIINAIYYKNSLCNLILHGNKNDLYLNAESSFINEMNTGSNNAIIFSKVKSETNEASEDINIEEVNRQRIINEMLEFKMKDYEKYAKRKEMICAICIKSFEENDLLKLFHCNEHVYHKECILEWTKKSNFCPLCKYNLKNN